MDQILHPRWLLVAISLWAGAALAQTLPPAGKPGSDRMLPMEVVVNGVNSGTWLMLDRAGVLYAPRDAFVDWRVQLQPGTQGINFKGVEYFSLSAVAGFTAKMDFATQTVDLSFSAESFAMTRLSGPAANRPSLSPALPSAFFNYDISYTRIEPNAAPSSEDLGMTGELGFSAGWGVLTHTFVGRNLTDDAPPLPTDGWTRLETTYTKDFLDEGRTLRIGDTSTRVNMWGRKVYYGGIQYGTNFALTPGFISQPLPVLSGISTAPSTVELYVNDVLSRSTKVPTGPFVVDNFPIMTGGGEARLVVRDLLGRESVVTLPFFVTAQMLSAGLDDWSVEAGSLRNNLGIEDSNYGPSFATGLWRHGYSDSLTLEGRAEATSDLSTLGAGAIWLMPWQLLGKAAAVASDDQNLGGGNLWLLGLEHQRMRAGGSIEVQGATREFRQLGQGEGVLPLKRQVAGNAYYASPEFGTFGLGVAALERYDTNRITTVSGNYSVRIGKRSNLNANVSRVVDGGDGKSASLIFSMPLDGNRFFSAYTNTRDGNTDYYATATQNIDSDHALGWRVMAGQVQEETHGEAGAHYLGRHGRVSGELSHTPDFNTTRLGANGGLVFADSSFFATQRVDQSFAVAEVAGYGDVGIGLNSNMMSRTDASGRAIIPQLAPYQTNSIRIDPRELPINAEVDSIEQTAVPAWRSAVKVTFPVRGGRGALLRIVLDDGKPAPAGAVVQIEGDKEEFYVARRGEAFVTGLQPTNRLVMDWNDRKCRFDVTLPPESPDEIPRIGPITCRGVAR